MLRGDFKGYARFIEIFADVDHRQRVESGLINSVHSRSCV